MESTLIPVILDTDIGTDIDDHWAVAMLLGCHELDLRLISTASGDPVYRAGLAGAILTAGGRTDVPLAVGIPTSLGSTPLHMLPTFAANHPMEDYRGPHRDDGVAAIVETIMASTERVTVIAIGPLTNLAAALRLEPRIVERSRLIAMAGWLGAAEAMRAGPVEWPIEYNVICDIEACREVFASGWDITLVPTDACGLITITGDRYERLRSSRSPVLQQVFECYLEWCDVIPLESARGAHHRGTTILYDTLPVALAYDESFVDLVDANVTLGAEGLTTLSSDGYRMRVALEWRDFEGYLSHLTERLLKA